MYVGLGCLLYQLRNRWTELEDVESHACSDVEALVQFIVACDPELSDVLSNVFKGLVDNKTSPVGTN